MPRPLPSRRPPRSGFTIAELGVTSILVSLLFGIAFGSLVYGLRITRKETSRLSLVHGLVVLRTLLGRDISRVVDADPPTVPSDAILRLPTGVGDRPVTYLGIGSGPLSGAIYRHEEGVTPQRIGGNLRARVTFSLDPDVGAVVLEAQGLDATGQKVIAGAPVIRARFRWGGGGPSASRFAHFREVEP